MNLASAAGSNAASMVLGFIFITVGVVAYIAPSLIASYRRSANLSPVVVVNIFLGWTVIGWIVALAMAVSGPSGRRPKVPPPYQWQPPRQWQRR